MKIAIFVTSSLFFCNIVNAAYSSEHVYKLPTNVTVTADERKFDPKRHKISGCVPEGGGGSKLQTVKECIVDGKHTVGASMVIPKTYLRSLSVNYYGVTYFLPVKSMYNPLLSETIGKGKFNFGGFCYDKLNCNFRGLFGDASGTYSAEWKIENGRVYRTMLTESADVNSFVKDNITPPQYN